MSQGQLINDTQIKIFEQKFLLTSPTTRFKDEKDRLRDSIKTDRR